jgi:hypothetical protein
MFAHNPGTLFIHFTKLLLKQKKVYNVNLSATENIRAKAVVGIFDYAFKDKKENKFGIRMKWSRWLVNGVFPVMLYKKNNSSLNELLNDKRLYDEPSYNKMDSTHSFFGRLARPRDKISEYGNFKGYVDYMLYRLENVQLRSQPHFYFDIENPEWVYRDFAKNPNQLKTIRTSMSCVSNISFRWNSSMMIPVLTLIIRHNQWSHLYGDIFGASRMLLAIRREMYLRTKLKEWKNKGNINIYLISSTMDDSKRAKQIINKWENKYGTI